MWLTGSSLSHVGSFVVAPQTQELRHGGAMARRILVPHPGIKPVSSALQGRFLTTGPPGKSQAHPFSLSLCRLGKESVELSQLKGLRKIGAAFFVSPSSSPCIFFFFPNLLNHLNKKDKKQAL